MSPELLELTLRATLEGFLIAAAFWLMLYRLDAAQHLARLGTTPVVAFSAFMVFWIAAHLADRGQYFYPQPASFYPAARFAMYEAGEPRETIPSYRLEGRLADRSAREIDLASFFPSVDLASFDSRMLAVSSGLRSSDPQRRQLAEREIEGYLEGIRSILAVQDERRLVEVSFHATRHRISDRALVQDTMLWNRSYGEPGGE